MLFRPAILALLLAAAANAAAVLGAAPFAVRVVRHWNLSSGSETQLSLERRTYLVSALLRIVLATQLLALLLFVFNASKMAPLFTGAMCAAGVLNANAYGYPALIAQILTFFLSAVWLALHHTDTLAADYPLVRTKYALLLWIAPAWVATGVLELLYFLNLKADVITSCCSRVFAAGAKGLSGDLAALAPGRAMLLCYASLGIAIAAAAHSAIRRRAGYALAAASAVAFAAAVTGILSFLSLYIYEHPNHHCPFCILKPEYGFQGYWLYIPLFAATACGLSAGAIQLFAQTPSLHTEAPRVCAQLAKVAAVGFALFALFATYFILNSHLILIAGALHESTNVYSTNQRRWSGALRAFSRGYGTSIRRHREVPALPILRHGSQALPPLAHVARVPGWQRGRRVLAALRGNQPDALRGARNESTVGGRQRICGRNQTANRR